MDEREFEQDYANYNRKLNQVLRSRNVKGFKMHVARHPGQAGKLSHCLGLSDELAEVEMHKVILLRPGLNDLHRESQEWLKNRGIEPPKPRTKKTGLRGKKGFGKRRKKR